VIHETNPALVRIVRDLPGGRDPPDAAGINLHEAQAGIVNQVARLMIVVAALTPASFTFRHRAASFA